MRVQSDRGAQTLEAHFGEQRDVLRIAVIEIDRHVLDAAVARRARRNGAEDALRLQIGGRQPLAVGLIRAFYGSPLPRRPQKMLRKLAVHRLLLN